MISALAHLTTRRSVAVLGLLVAITIAALIPIAGKGIKQDFSPHLLPPEHPSRLAFDRVREEFTGSGESVLVHLRHPETIFNASTMRRTLELTEAFQSIALLPAPSEESALREILPALAPDLQAAIETILSGGITEEDRDAVVGLQVELSLQEMSGSSRLGEVLAGLMVRLQPVRKVTSLANVKNILARGDTLEIRKVYEAAPASPEELNRLRTEVMSNKLFRGVLVSDDGRSTGIIVETWLPPEDTGLMYDLYQRITAIVAATPGTEETGIAGVPAAVALGRNFMEKDSLVLFPIVIVLVLGALYLTFRSIGGVLLPLVVVILAIVWTLGLMAWLDIPLNLITNALPVFLITIGVADGVHMISEFKHGLSFGKDRREAVAYMLRHMTLPVVMTSITTGVGFLSLAYTEIRYVKLFGIFVAVGVMAAMAVSLLLIPAALTWGRTARVPIPDLPRNPANRAKSRFAKGLGRLSAFTVERHRLILMVFVGLAAWAAFGVGRIVVDSDVIAYFQDDVPIVQASRSLDEHMAGSTSMYLLVNGPQDVSQPFKDPKMLAGIEHLQRHLELYFPFVGSTLSLADLVRRMNLVMHGDDPQHDRLPRETEWATSAPGSGTADANSLYVPVSGGNLISQYLLLYEGGGGDILSDLVDSEYRSLRIGVTLTTSSSPAIRALTQEAKRYASAHLPPGTDVRFAGWGELNASMTDEMVRGQIASLALSVGAVFIVLLILFRSTTQSILAMVPLLFTILFNFGVMGWFGISLDIGTALVAAIALGIGIDYAIHYLSRLNTELRDGASGSQAIAFTMMASGKAIAANALVVAVGFLALTFSEFNPIKQIGWLVSQTLLISAVATLVLLPALVTFFRPGFAYSGAGRLGGEPNRGSAEARLASTGTRS